MEARGLSSLVLVLVVCGCLGLFVPSVSAVGPETGTASVQTQPEERTQLEAADEVHVEAFIHSNGSATFTVDYRFENTSSESWVTLAEDVETHPEAYAANESDDWTEVLEEGEDHTDREMELSNMSVTTDTSSTPRDMGHVEFTFVWSSFADVELNRIEAGDALVGFTLVDDTTLQFLWPEEYSVREVEPAPDTPPEDSVLWSGDEVEFADDQPSVILIENGETTTTVVDSEEGPTMPWLVVAIAFAVLAGAGAAGWWFKRAERLPGDQQPPESAAGSHPPDSSAEPMASAAEQGPPPELLSNEERVLQLLSERGGRIKQQEVVSELEWTEAKTSQVVTSLREDDEIDVFRIGRENVLSLPDAGDDAQ